MINYQLYRTNVLLGGQMKYDIIVGSNGQDLVVNDFHITPISNNIPYNKYVEEDLLNYKHSENINKFYKKISDVFYNTFEDSQLTKPYPILSDSGSTHNDEYEMGCRRLKYKLYGKQFEFFCPVWLEKVDGDINFQFEIYSASQTIQIKNLILKPVDDSQYHNKFVSYLNDYMEEIGIMKGNDDVININLESGDASITGMNVGSGIVMTRSLPFLVNDLTKREVPLIDVDNHIISCIKDNQMVVSQLFNFNICFNIDDILPKNLTTLMIGKNVHIRVKVGVGDKLLGVRDFYSNYEYIPKKYCGPRIIAAQLDGSFLDITEDDRGLFIPELNVLSYLKDYDCVDYVTKNKITQSVIHWSLNDENNYIFNLYNGFAGYYINDDGEDRQYILLTHLYGNTPNINLYEDNIIQNTQNWCNNIYLNTSKSGVFLSGEHMKNLENFCSVFKNNCIINGIRYQIENEDERECKILFIEIANFLPLNGFKDIKDIEFDGVKYKCYINENVILIFHTDYNGRLSYQKAKDFLNNLNGMDADTSFILELMKRNNFDRLGTIITPRKSLSLSKAESPSLSSYEIEYYKEDNPGEWVDRQYGKIKPTFISMDNDVNFNYKYYKKRYEDLSDSEKNILKSYLNTGYPPIYPSIDYFYFTKEKEDYEKNGVGFEWHNFNNNSVIYLENAMDVVLESKEDNGKYVKVETLIKEFLRNKYYADDALGEYIYNLYDWTGWFDYKSKDNINDYIYSIKLTLK